MRHNQQFNLLGLISIIFGALSLASCIWLLIALPLAAMGFLFGVLAVASTKKDRHLGVVGMALNVIGALASIGLVVLFIISEPPYVG